MTTGFQAKPAVRERVPLLVGLTGASGGGKTLSALRLATGIARVVKGPIYFIDTENGRANHYADDFRFMHVPFDAEPPESDWTPDRYVEALEYCRRDGAGVVIVDSASHEHEALHNAHEAALDKMAGNDWRKREACNMIAWAKAKAPRKKLLSYVRRLNLNVIFCFRAHSTVKPVKVNGKTEIVNQGFVPVAAPEWVFEMTANVLLMPNSGGVPTWQSEYPGESLAIKNPVQFHRMFSERKPLDEDTGEALARWAAGSATPRTGRPEPDEIASLCERLRACDRAGLDAIKAEARDLYARAEGPQRKLITALVADAETRITDLDAAQPDTLFPGGDAATNLPG